MQRQAFLEILNGLLQPQLFNDVGENGLQVEGADDIKTVVCGVTANLAFIDAAIERRADAIVVHHGLVWGGGIRRLDGWLMTRVRRLMDAGINLFAYHLPLDAHADVGNNAGLGRALGVVDPGPFGRFKGQSIGLKGRFAEPLSLAALVTRAREEVVGDGVMFAFGDQQRPLETIGLCTGGAPDLIHEAINARLDVYVTGEVTEYVKAVAEESGTCFLGLGHHATERFGPRALAEHLATRLGPEGIEVSFVDVENPV